MVLSDTELRCAMELSSDAAALQYDATLWLEAELWNDAALWRGSLLLDESSLLCKPSLHGVSDRFLKSRRLGTRIHRRAMRVTGNRWLSVEVGL